MSKSYVESTRKPAARREAAVRPVRGIIERIVSEHAVFDTEASGDPLITPLVFWADGREDQWAHLGLYGPDGQKLLREDTEHLPRALWRIGSAVLYLGGERPEDQFTGLIVEMEPCNIKRYDGAAVPTLHVPAAIADIQRYEQQALAGRFL